MATISFNLKRGEGWTQITTGVETGTFQISGGFVEITESATLPSDDAPTQSHRVFTVVAPMIMWARLPVLSEARLVGIMT